MMGIGMPIIQASAPFMGTSGVVLGGATRVGVGWFPLGVC